MKTQLLKHQHKSPILKNSKIKSQVNFSSEIQQKLKKFKQVLDKNSSNNKFSKVKHSTSENQYFHNKNNLKKNKQNSKNSKAIQQFKQLKAKIFDSTINQSQLQNILFSYEPLHSIKSKSKNNESNIKTKKILSYSNLSQEFCQMQNRLNKFQIAKSNADQQDISQKKIQKNNESKQLLNDFVIENENLKSEQISMIQKQKSFQKIIFPNQAMTQPSQTLLNIFSTDFSQKQPRNISCLSNTSNYDNYYLKPINEQRSSKDKKHKQAKQQLPQSKFNSKSIMSYSMLLSRNHNKKTKRFSMKISDENKYRDWLLIKKRKLSKQRANEKRNHEKQKIEQSIQKRKKSLSTERKIFAQKTKSSDKNILKKNNRSLSNFSYKFSSNDIVSECNKQNVFSKMNERQIQNQELNNNNSTNNSIFLGFNKNMSIHDKMDKMKYSKSKGLFKNPQNKSEREEVIKQLYRKYQIQQLTLRLKQQLKKISSALKYTGSKQNSSSKKNANNSKQNNGKIKQNRGSSKKKDSQRKIYQKFRQSSAKKSKISGQKNEKDNKQNNIVLDMQQNFKIKRDKINQNSKTQNPLFNNESSWMLNENILQCLTLQGKLNQLKGNKHNQKYQQNSNINKMESIILNFNMEAQENYFEENKNSDQILLTLDKKYQNQKVNYLDYFSLNNKSMSQTIQNNQNREEVNNLNQINKNQNQSNQDQNRFQNNQNQSQNRQKNSRNSLNLSKIKQNKGQNRQKQSKNKQSQDQEIIQIRKDEFESPQRNSLAFGERLQTDLREISIKRIENIEKIVIIQFQEQRATIQQNEINLIKDQSVQKELHSEQQYYHDQHKNNEGNLIKYREINNFLRQKQDQKYNERQIIGKQQERKDSQNQNQDQNQNQSNQNLIVEATINKVEATINIVEGTINKQKLCTKVVIDKQVVYPKAQNLNNMVKYEKQGGYFDQFIIGYIELILKCSFKKGELLKRLQRPLGIGSLELLKIMRSQSNQAFCQEVVKHLQQRQQEEPEEQQQEMQFEQQQQMQFEQQQRQFGQQQVQSQKKLELNYQQNRLNQIQRKQNIHSLSHDYSRNDNHKDNHNHNDSYFNSMDQFLQQQPIQQPFQQYIISQDIYFTLQQVILDMIKYNCMQLIQKNILIEENKQQINGQNKINPEYETFCILNQLNKLITIILSMYNQYKQKISLNNNKKQIKIQEQNQSKQFVSSFTLEHQSLINVQCFYTEYIKTFSLVIYDCINLILDELRPYGVYGIPPCTSIYYNKKPMINNCLKQQQKHEQKPQFQNKFQVKQKQQYDVEGMQRGYDVEVIQGSKIGQQNSNSFCQVKQFVLNKLSTQILAIKLGLLTQQLTQQPHHHNSKSNSYINNQNKKQQEQQQQHQQHQQCEYQQQHQQQLSLSQRIKAQPTNNAIIMNFQKLVKSNLQKQSKITNIQLNRQYQYLQDVKFQIFYQLWLVIEQNILNQEINAVRKLL